MPLLQLSEAFRASYLDFKSYPTNLIPENTVTYPTVLKAYKTRLDSEQDDLVMSDEQNVEVSFRDFRNASGHELEKINVHTQDKLRSWLGVETATDTVNASKIIVFSKRDPKCRFIYIFGEHSKAHLKITRDMLSETLTYHQVMPVYLDFISVFGAQSDARDLRFSGFREQTTLNGALNSTWGANLGRSGLHYQLCYNLKTVVLNSEADGVMRNQEWSIRPAAIYHQFDVIEGTTLWIVTTGHRDLKERYKELTGKDGRPADKSFDTLKQCFRSSLAAHLLFCHWSTEGWRWYIRWLENVLEDETSMAVLGPRGPEHAHQMYKPQHIQDLQLWQDKTNEAVMVLEANVDVMTTLSKFYGSIGENKNTPSVLKDECSIDILDFAAKVEDMISDLKMQISRANLLVKITSDRKELVSQHLQSQATERMEILNYHMDREVIVMRIITIVTLVYLPGTFVSTFFSTDIIKYQTGTDEEDGNGRFSKTALMRWLQITLTLTTLTLVVAWFAFKGAERGRIGQGYMNVNNSQQWKTKHRRRPLKEFFTANPILPTHN